MPAKPKWTRRRTYRRIRNQIQALEAKAKTQRFKKPQCRQAARMVSTEKERANLLARAKRWEFLADHVHQDPRN
jgi:hypothetical protein